MNDNHMKKKLFTGAMMGTIAGMAVVMFDKRVRESVMDRTKTYGSKTKQWIVGVREDPRTFMNQIRRNIEQVTDSMKEVSVQLQDMLEQMEDVRMTSTKVIESAKNAGQEMKEVGNSLVNINASSDNTQPERDGEHLSKLH